jgi:hypothetical protein
MVDSIAATLRLSDVAKCSCEEGGVGGIENVVQQEVVLVNKLAYRERLCIVIDGARLIVKLSRHCERFC